MEAEVTMNFLQLLMNDIIYMYHLIVDFRSEIFEIRLKLYPMLPCVTVIVHYYSKSNKDDNIDKNIKSK